MHSGHARDRRRDRRVDDEITLKEEPHIIIITRYVHSPELSVVVEMQSHVLSFLFRKQCPFFRSVTENCSIKILLDCSMNICAHYDRIQNIL